MFVFPFIKEEKKGEQASEQQQQQEEEEEEEKEEEEEEEETRPRKQPCVAERGDGKGARKCDVVTEEGEEEDTGAKHPPPGTLPGAQWDEE